ncbi:protein MCM10 homolog [Neoarius graeffei]|uniref:protein MCM10 homolog n=1 Tax=Neoarius graeffei TaxID=443677 RepID=UPI00298C6BA9|nr:protein MCM10 homolog [Neoarius graeffei]
MTAEDENLDSLLSLFEESEGKEPENFSSKEEDNLDGLFDDDEEGEGYVEPEEDEDLTLTLENSGTGMESEHNRSKEDLEAELRSMQEKMQKLQQQLEASQKCTDVSRPKRTENNVSSQRQTSSKSSLATQQSSRTLTSPQQSSRALTSPQQSSRALTSPQQSSRALTSPQQSSRALTSPQQSSRALTSPQQSSRALTSPQQSSRALTSPQQSSRALTSPQQSSRTLTSPQQSSRTLTSPQQSSRTLTSPQQSSRTLTSPQQSSRTLTSPQQSSRTLTSPQQSSRTLTSPQQSSRTLTSPQQSSKTPQRAAAVFPSPQYSAVELTGKVQSRQRTAHQPKAASLENQSFLDQGVSDRLSQPMRSSRTVNNTTRSPPASKSAGVAPPIVRQATPRPSVTQDVTVEKFSGLRLRRPRLSSVEIEHKMANRRMIRLSQLPDRIARENLEDSDWVTFAVLINKITPQSKNNGKTFSIWKLNDLHNLDVNVSLFLFGTVHTDLWKTDTGTVIGILNPNQMKNKDGSSELCLTVDHPQKVLMLGEAMDFGTCKAKKKNGDSCTQLVNLYECQYCQYHVKAQYKKMSSKRAELQSSYTGTAPRKRKGHGSLRERLCQSEFHYGGLSSLACAPSVTAPQPKKQPSIQAVLASIPNKKLAISSGEVTGCSDDFRSLMTMPTPGALNIKKHLGQSKTKELSGSSIQSISAAELLKQQKTLHQQRFQARQKRAEEIQKRVLQNTGGAVIPPRPSMNGAVLPSPKAASEVPKGSSPPKPGLSTPPVPALGRGYTEGEDILLDISPPPCSKSISAAKLAAVKKLQAKGVALIKNDPNAVKRKQPNSSDITARVERSLASPEGENRAEWEAEEPAQKRRREQLDYIQSDEFQRILNAKSTNSWIMGEVEEKVMHDYFEPLVQKEKLEEKMKSIKEMKCRAVTCKTCKYTHFKPAERCIEEKHDYHWHDAIKRFFKCPCSQRKISLSRFPTAACSNCGVFKWERDSMLKEKNGPKIGGELLLPRGEEHSKFLNSLK